MEDNESKVQEAGTECGTAFGYWDNREAVAYQLTQDIINQWNHGLVPRVMIAFLLDDTFENETDEQLDWTEEWF
jgi:hypothetical protein